MNPSIFFDNFSLLADSPNGVQKLREMILQLAVMGKLVPQDPNDEPASVLLERIQSEKKKLDSTSRIKQIEKLSEIDDSDMPYDVPYNWEWVRLENICSYIQRGKSPKYIERSDIPVIAQKCIQWDGIKIERALFIDPDSLKSYGEERFLKTGDLLWNSTGVGTLGRIQVYSHEENPYDIVVADSHVTVIRPVFVDSYFVYCWAANPLIQMNMDSVSSGSTKQTELATSTVKSFVLPLPPLEEQKRIVAKVDQLMTLCDELEALHQHRNESRVHLNNAAINKLLDAGSANEFDELWQLIHHNFDLLYDNLDNVTKLRQAILQLAVMGKLVPQDPNDEPASVLLEKISDEKERMAKAGKIAKTKSFNSLDITEVPFELPLGWSWTRMGDITQKLGAGSTPKGGKSIYLSEGVKFIRSQNVWNNGLSLENVAMIPRTIHEKMSGTYVEQGDILLNITGASIGRSSVVQDDFDEGNVSQHVAIIRLVDKTIRGFIHVVIVSPFIQNQIMEAQVGISREGLSMNRLRDFILPLPPLEEQKRIVAKVDQLLALCDELEVRIRKSEEDGEKITNAVVSNLTAM